VSSTSPVERNGSPANAVGAFFAFLLFIGGIVLFTVAFSVSEGAAPWVFVGGIFAIALSFGIPTTILPALEDRES
jgi:regulator of protease activity HflC (stomatin/prohibitin superfamily)